MTYYLAIDLGATSGRHVIGYEKEGRLILEEVHRFKTEMDLTNDGLVWNLPRIFSEIKEGLKKAFAKYKTIHSLAIDTWGVDYVLMNKDCEITPFYAYRHARCEKSTEALHQIIHFNELYARTGIQYLPFNTIYQLFDDLQKGRLKEATDYLMLPSYFTYKLTGVKTHEYTNESTGAFLDAQQKDYDFTLIDKLGLPRTLFKKIEKPGFAVGSLLKEIEEEVGGNTKVLLCASHDTASAFEAVEEDENSIILSSGTWSLLGVKLKEALITEQSKLSNYTNEGGVGYYRFLKNIMGMYIANRLREETGLSLEDISKTIQDSDYKETFDINDASLLHPTNMKDALLSLLKENPPKSNIDLFASVYRSMALGYRMAIKELEDITGKKYTRLLIIGGGAHNAYLNEQVKAYTSLEVIPLPIEATALGNIRLQMKVSGKK